MELREPCLSRLMCMKMQCERGLMQVARDPLPRIMTSRLPTESFANKLETPRKRLVPKHLTTVPT